jgi:uncharacterized protein YndB with AHSA1/START domain
MIRIAASQTIARPIEDVFAFVSDATNEPKWHTDVLEVSRTSNGPAGAGSTFRWVVDFMGHKEMHVRVVGFEPNRREIIQATSGPMLPMITYLFEAHDSGTRFTRSVEVQPAGVFRLMQPMMRGMMAKRNAGFLENLKHVLESNGE